MDRSLRLRVKSHVLRKLQSLATETTCAGLAFCKLFFFSLATGLASGGVRSNVGGVQKGKKCCSHLGTMGYTGLANPKQWEQGVRGARPHCNRVGR